VALETLSVFEEATQTASRFLTLPISALGILQGEALLLKAAVGLSHLGFMNPLARTRRLPCEDALIADTCQQGQYLALPDVAAVERYQSSLLVTEYSVKSFLGVPLRTSTGDCVGVLMAMDTQPRSLDEQAIAFMEMVARWSMSEYERHRLAAEPPATAVDAAGRAASTAPVLDHVRLNLISQLIQELRTPLTSITGMAGMLNREIYGPLTPKQQEYTEIIRSSSQRLLETVDEVIELGHLSSEQTPLVPATVDIEMLGQQVMNALMSLAKQHNLELHLTVEPRSRLWLLDKTLIKQLLHHLIFCVLHIAGEGGTIRLHASQRDQGLGLAVWLSNPWLGEGLPSSVMAFQPYLSDSEAISGVEAARMDAVGAMDGDDHQRQSAMARSREVLALILSRYLAERHGGNLTLQGTTESGYRFLVWLPAQEGGA
jgi:signal transduction histidine kinase